MDVTPRLESISAPTLLTTGRNDPMWTMTDARAAAARLRNGALAVLPGSGHVGPLLEAPLAVIDLTAAFWQDPSGTVGRHLAS